MDLELLSYIFLGIIFLIIITATCLYFFVFKDKKPHEIAIKINDTIEHNLVSDNDKSKNHKEKRGKAVQEKPSSSPSNSLLNIDTITNDMVISNKSSLFTMVIECKGVNLNLMSDEEKFSIEQSFIELIRTITFPFKIHIQTRTKSFKDSIASNAKNILNLETEISEMVNRFNQLHSVPDKSNTALAQLLYQIQKKQRLYEYSKNLTNQIETLSNNNFTLDKNYYISASCSPEELGSSNSLPLEKNLDMAYSELSKRCEIIIKGLEKCLVQASIVKSYQLAELLYKTFDQDEENLLKLRSFLDSGVIRLYSSKKA